MNNIIFHTDIEQKSEAWHELRLGKITGSKVNMLMGKKGLGQTGLTYINSLAAEILTGKERFIRPNSAMLHGDYYEPVARNFYSKLIGIEFNELGFVENSDYKNCGASPDGLNYDNELGIEIKCPENQGEHFSYLQFVNQEDLKKSKHEYYWQIMFCLLITNFKTWKFISFHPDFNHKRDLRLYSIDVYWNQQDVDLLINRIKEANNILESILKLEHLK